MKTDICKFEKGSADFDSISGLAAKVAAYNKLDKKQELKLTLLCEELVEMLPNLLAYGKGEFWIENEGRQYKIHTVVEADDLLPTVERDKILSVSTSGKNAAATGIMSKIRAAAEVMLANYAATVGTAGTLNAKPIYTYYNMGRFSAPVDYTNEWSLALYKENAKADKDAWDELEKSIIVNLADDVTVGIIGGRVEIVAIKTF